MATVAAWAAAAGIETPRRLKVLRESLWLTAVQLLTKGNAKALVAERCGVSIVTVTRVLRSVPGLQSNWHSVRQVIARDIAREAWLNAASVCRELGIAVSRKLKERVTHLLHFLRAVADLLQEQSHIYFNGRQRSTGGKGDAANATSVGSPASAEEIATR